MTARLTFCGGAGSVTGANFLLDTGSKRILVDCGTEEQEKVCDALNSKPFPYDPASIDVLFVTHAHQDHIGKIPKLVRDGFRGAIHSTRATKDIAAEMLEDALHVMTEHARSHGCLPLYSAADIEQALALWSGHEYHEQMSVGDIEAEFLDAGHILGSAMVRLARNGRTILFTGDLGNTPEPLLQPTESPRGAHYVVMESVYGDRLHEKRDERRDVLEEAVEEARRQRGVLLIPSFSIERTQVLLFELNTLVERGMQPIPIYLDAPLAIRLTAYFRRYSALLNPEVRAHFERGDDPFSFKGLHVIKDVRESQAIHKEPDPKVIIAGAGMSGGGRIRAHEARYLSHKQATVLFSGFQAPGTLGRALLDGERHVDIDGERIRVRAQMRQLTGYSGHADRDQLLSFIQGAGEQLATVFVTMGEPKASLFLAQRMHDFLGLDARVPERGESADLDF
jgi:metallo-beta-lactamase family protein